jgi:hypothetical protein
MPGAMTARLVVTGFNRYVRNPIYVGSVTIFVGEALLFGQLNLLLYALAAWIGTALFVRSYEKPALARRFGADYETYRRAVPAWRPRLHPWSPDGPPFPVTCDNAPATRMLRCGFAPPRRSATRRRRGVHFTRR